MNIFYKKDTLYVTLDELVDREVIDTVESRVNAIMSSYNIPNLVIDTNGQNVEHFKEFEQRYNHGHSSKVIIK